MNSLSPNPSIDNSSEDLISIYGLVDPETELVFYIGKSLHPENRFQQHLRDHSPSYKATHIQSLLAKGLYPELHIIERVPRDQGEMREIYWMKHYQEQGHPITNVVNNNKVVDRVRTGYYPISTIPSEKYVRKTYYSNLQCDENIAIIRNRYHLSTESDAIRVALQMLASADLEIELHIKKKLPIKRRRASLNNQQELF